MSDDVRLDVERCEALVTLALRGVEGTWRDLVDAVWPTVLRVIVGNPAMRRFRGDADDHAREVATSVIEKLGRDGMRGLRSYVEWKAQQPDKTFKDWLFIVTANAVRDHARAVTGRAPSADGERLPSVKRVLNEFLTSPNIEREGVRPPMTAAQTARELIEFARARLRPDQLGALMRWLEGVEPEEIAIEMDLGGEDDAHRLVRSALAVLRREFAGGEKIDRGA